jgi:DNA polymerase-3 subunit gamma/tau
MVGNKGTIESLKKKLVDENRPHTYLFSGESGCGKTTAARIMARELGGEETNIIEINCSSENGVDTARTIIDQMSSRPFDGGSLIFILDELHMTSKNFQNALLKPLEDTTPWTYFFLCTTNPEKLLPTIKSRSSKYNFTPPFKRELVRLLRNIIDKENKECSLEVLEKIIEKSESKPRECLTTLEMILDIETEEGRIKLLDKYTSSSSSIELCRTLLKAKSWDEVIPKLKNLNGEPETIRRMVLGYMSSVLLKGDNPKAALIIDCFSTNYYDTGKAGLVKSCYEIFI